LVFALIAGIGSKAEAAVYRIDLFAGGGDGTAYPLSSNVCGGPSTCGPPGYQSSRYFFDEGGTVDFGTLILSDFVVCDARGGTGCFIFHPSFGNGGSGPPAGRCDFVSCELHSYTIPLVYTIADGEALSFAWSGSYSYLAPAVPEPSTWAMMVLGFAGVGCMTFRRRRVVSLAA
jgi:hypothetical protein